jgi:crossover junction endodeoxyribonuclease RusA
MDPLNIEGKPVPKGRAIPIMVNGKPRMVPDSKTRTYETQVARAWREAGLPTHEGPVSVNIVLYPDHVEVAVEPLDVGKSPVRGDVDNYAKSVLDGLNTVAFKDDRQVYVLNVVKVADEH